MAKNKPALPAAESALQFVSLSSLGYSAAKAGDEMESLAALALDNVPEFASCDKHTEVSKETKAEFSIGARQRWNELPKNKPVEYAVIDDNYIRCDALEEEVLAKVIERVIIGGEVVFALTQQEFGGMKDKNPKLHAIHKDIRDRCNTYCSNAFKDLFVKAKKLQALRAGKSSTREQAKLYGKWLEDLFSEMKTRAISAESRGDATVHRKELDDAIIAFKTKYPYFN